MKKSLSLITVLMLVLLGNQFAYAQDPGTKEDNACNEGGSMAGKCDTPWEWVCGYYLARWEANGGWNTPNNVLNDACVSLLPPRAIQEGETTSVPTPTCRDFRGWMVCITGNYIAVDVSWIAGPLNIEYLIVAPLTPCPAPFTDNSFAVDVMAFDIAQFIKSFGFLGTDKLCINFVP